MLTFIGHYYLKEVAVFKQQLLLEGFPHPLGNYSQIAFPCALPFCSLSAPLSLALPVVLYYLLFKRCAARIESLPIKVERIVALSAANHVLLCSLSFIIFFITVRLR